MKRSKPCRICRVSLTFERDLLFYESYTISKFKLLELSDRGCLKYPSEVVLESIANVLKIFICIENESELMEIFVKGIVEIF